MNEELETPRKKWTMRPEVIEECLKRLSDCEPALVRVQQRLDWLKEEVHSANPRPYPFPEELS